MMLLSNNQLLKILAIQCFVPVFLRERQGFLFPFTKV
jgi:hypothetical protein